MKTDRELLELAAKAAGELTPSWYGNSAYMGGVLSRWNPLTDDGDALRLAVKLGLNISWLKNDVEVNHNNHLDRWLERFHSDPYAATRRAIVRAAAAQGEQE